jgi:Tfp pilus assembly protein PilF/DNA-directed RNA polymerase subunit RPC12/RpoP
MSTKYFCAHCNKEFVPEDAVSKPRCPQCMRRGGVELVKEVAPEGGANRSWLLIVALVIVAAGIGYGVYRATTVSLEETPPLRPLEARELSAYLERDQILVGAYEPMMVLPNEVEGWPEGAAELAVRMHGESSPWSLELPLSRGVLTADQALAMMDAHEERVALYPLELATAMAALLRERGTKAMVAEVWEFEGARAPADPSGMLGYFVTAVYDESASEEPSAYFDPWGGRDEVKVSSVRVLRDTEVLAAALGTDAMRIIARSGDGPKALPMVETALLLDPASPSLRIVNGTVLLESGGVAQAVNEFEAALQLRPDGPRQLKLMQLHLAQAGMLEMNGQQAEAEAQFSKGSRTVAEVIEKWPRYGRAHLMLATIHLGLDEPERARVELEIAENLNPDAPMLWAVWAQYHLAQSDPIAAAAKMKRAVALDPDNWQLRLQAARIFQGAGDGEAAAENVGAAMQLVPLNKRPEVRQFVERMMGPGALGDAPAPATEEGADTELDLPDPAMILGDPSNLRLQEPGQRLKLDLDE